MIWILGILSFVCTATTLASLTTLPWGWVRIFDFPRVQNLVIALIGAALSVAFLEPGLALAAIGGGFVFSAVVQAWKVARFTPIWPMRSVGYEGNPARAKTVSLLISNVKMGNRDYDRLRQLVNHRKADICIFMEVDEPWIEGLHIDRSLYPHQINYPQDNGYGMLLVSRFELVSHEIRFLLKDQVPSFDCIIRHPTGSTFRLIAVHPEPPVPQKGTEGRDAELILVGEIAKDEPGSLIVTGDLNDVAWSPTTRRFLRISRLLDPREGRGFYNSFHAHWPIFRWPLDHIFHSSHFKLVEMERLPDVGSDHFPMFIRLALTSDESVKREHDEPTRQDMQEAREVVELAEERDDEPVGTDWEK